MANGADMTSIAVPLHPCPHRASLPRDIALRLAVGVAACVATTTATAVLAKPGGPSVASDLSQLTLSAAPTVQLVMLALLAASILSWATLIVKWRELHGARRTLRQAVHHVAIAQRHTEVSSSASGNPALHQMLAEAQDEWNRSEQLLKAGHRDGVKERIGARIQEVETRFANRMSLGLGILATVSAVAPFVGLFGTVWGIMHSFIGIAASNTTSLAVVAPGIAEALLATGLGLAAAIPATLMYNALSRFVGIYRAELSACATTLMCLVSRDLDGVAASSAEHMLPLAAVKLPRPSAVAGH